MEKRTIQDFVSLYELEPEIRNIWVEGETDAAVMSWFLDACGIRDVDVRTPDEVDVDAEMVAKYGLLPGNRSRIISLALEVGVALKGNKNCATVVAVADRDFDDLLGRRIQCDLLIYTEFSSLEMFCADKEVLEKLLKICRIEQDASELLDASLCIAKQVSLLRACALSLKKDWSWVCFKGSMLRKGKASQYNFNSHLNRYLDRNAGRNDGEIFLKRFDELLEIADGRELMVVRGHDFIDVLFHFIKDILRPAKVIQSPDGLFVALFMGVPPDHLKAHSPFKDIILRFSAD